MARTKLAPKKKNIRLIPLREQNTQNKIKTLLPEQKAIKNKKERASRSIGNS